MWHFVVEGRMRGAPLPSSHLAQPEMNALAAGDKFVTVVVIFLPCTSVVFLLSFLFRAAVGFEGSGTLGLAASLIMSPLDLMLMTALVMTIGLLDDLCSSLWLFVSESVVKECISRRIELAR